MSAPLDGIRVVDLSHTLPGAEASQFLADAGAEVLMVERPGGSPLRANPGWPALARNKSSAVLDLHRPADQERLRALLAAADVAITTFRPATAEKLGLDGGTLSARYPRLISASITGFGSGPWRDVKGYEGLVMAKLGLLHVKRQLAARPGPAYVSVPFASWGAAHSAVHGILAALLEREESGAGQHVEADMVRGVHALDSWQWFLELVGLRWPDAYNTVEAFNDRGEIQGALIYALLASPTSDGTWLQFAQVEPRLFAAMLEEFGLADAFSDPKWAGLPVLPTQELRTEFWEIMLRRGAAGSLEEWQAAFDRNPQLCAEIFRSGSEPLDHPQILHDGRAVILDDPEVGPVRQPASLVFTADGPIGPLRPAPRLGEHAPWPGPAAGGEATPRSGRLPLEGVTIVEFGSMFAGPYGATLLTDYGARVIKIEPLGGDTIRRVLPFPESGAIKVMQGKESIALDLASPEGLAIVHDIVRRAQVVLQSFRAGAPERAKVDSATLLEINPGLLYVNAPGYGTGGPFGARPAYAPSIGAAAGLARTDAAHAVAGTDTLDDVKRAAVQLYNGTACTSLQADGIAALGCASTLLLGLVAAARGRPTGPLTAAMLGTAPLANLEHMIDYADRPPAATVDPDYRGLSALYRMYETSDGWLFVAAPAPDEWAPLRDALEGLAPLDDPRFATPAERAVHDSDLAAALGAAFATRSAEEWEELLTARDVGAARIFEGMPQRLILATPELRDEYATPVTGPIFDTYHRLTPLVRFSRSATTAGTFPRAGEQTDAILAEIGYDDERIADLRARGVVA